MNNDSIAHFFKTQQLLRFSKNDLVVHGGKRPSGVFYVEKGFVKAYSIDGQGQEYVHLVYGPGEVFPMLWGIADVIRNVSFSAMSHTLIWRAQKETLKERAEKDANFSFSLLQQMAQQLKVYADRVDNLQYRRAKDRLIYRLLYLAGRFGEHSDVGIVIKAPVTQHDISSSINLARESVTKEFARLEAEDLVRLDGRRIIITNLDRLRYAISTPASTDWWTDLTPTCPLSMNADGHQIDGPTKT